MPAIEADPALQESHGCPPATRTQSQHIATQRKNPGMDRSPAQHVRLPPHEAVIMLDPTTRNHLTREGRGAGATPPPQLN